MIVWNIYVNELWRAAKVGHGAQLVVAHVDEFERRAANQVDLLQAIVARHQALQAAQVRDCGEALQRIAAEVEFFEDVGAARQHRRRLERKERRRQVQVARIVRPNRERNGSIQLRRGWRIAR